MASALRDVVPRRAVFRLARRIGVDVIAQFGFLLALEVEHFRIEQRFLAALERLERILDAEQVAFGDARILRAFRAEAFDHAAHFGQTQQRVRRIQIARGFEFGDGELAIGAAGIADDDRHLAIVGAVLREREEIGDLGRLAVFVGAQHAHVEVVAREVEVVRIAAEERHREFRREDQAHILIAMVFVYIVDAAVIQVDDVAARAFGIVAGAFLLDRRLHRFLGLASIPRRICRPPPASRVA